MKQRYYFIDNLRWVVVLLVLLYHVFYNYNSLGIFGAIGGPEGSGVADIVMYPIYPWFMALLFALAGASSRYALRGRTSREFRRERTQKLLIPSTVGLLIFGWVLGMLNTHIAAASGNMYIDEVPLLVRYFIWVVSGTGPLWFLHDLFLFSLLLLPLRNIVSAEKVDEWLTKRSDGSLWILLVLVAPLLWGVAQSQIDSPTAVQGLINLYRPIFYFFLFLVGYYILSSERIHTLLCRGAWWLVGVAVVCAVVFTTHRFGEDYTAPNVVQSPEYNLFAWTATLALIGLFKRTADTTSPFADYMRRSSFGVYIVHMTVCTAICFWLKECGLSVVATYALAIVATFVGSFTLYEVLRHIPIVRRYVLGIVRRPKKLAQ